MSIEQAKAKGINFTLSDRHSEHKGFTKAMGI
jgi:hypothetical protein